MVSVADFDCQAFSKACRPSPDRRSYRMRLQRPQAVKIFEAWYVLLTARCARSQDNDPPGTRG